MQQHPVMSEKLRFVCTPQFPGVAAWLQHGHQEGLWDLTLMSDLTPTEVPADAPGYLLGAWHESYKPLIEQFNKAGLPWGVAWSSSPQESDTSRARVELAYLHALTTPQASPWKPHYWACLHPSMATVLPNAVHLPAPIHIEPVAAQRKEDLIGLFVPPTEKKAIFSQLVAVRQFQRLHPEAALATNLKSYEPVASWLGVNAIYYDWLPRDEYLKTLARCRIVMHASLAESFGYGAVDCMMADTPVVGSPAMHWLPWVWRATDANDPQAILNVMERLWRASPDGARGIIEEMAKEQNRRARVAVEALLQKASEAKITVGPTATNPQT